MLWSSSFNALFRKQWKIWSLIWRGKERERKRKKDRWGQACVPICREQRKVSGVLFCLIFLGLLGQDLSLDLERLAAGKAWRYPHLYHTTGGLYSWNYAQLFNFNIYARDLKSSPNECAASTLTNQYLDITFQNHFSYVVTWICICRPQVTEDQICVYGICF